MQSDNEGDNDEDDEMQYDDSVRDQSADENFFDPPIEDYRYMGSSVGQ